MTFRVLDWPGPDVTAPGAAVYGLLGGRYMNLGGNLTTAAAASLPAIVQGDAVLMDKRWWLNPTGFVVRYVIYFALWLLIAWLLNKWSREQDATGNPALADRMSTVSAPGVVVWAFVVTGAADDAPLGST